MKKLHILLLIITALLVIFSVYSLAAINQVYKIDYKWYSQYNNSFSEEARDSHDEKWGLNRYPAGFRLDLITNIDKKLDNADNQSLEYALKDTDFKKDILLYCSLGKMNSPEYKIKVTDIAQRGNVVEIKLSINSPLKISTFASRTYFPFDIVKINKASFAIKGKLFFIFKNQAGNKIGEKILTIK